MPHMMSQHDFSNPLSFRPDLTQKSIEATLAGLLHSGDIMDRRLEGCCRRLDQRFRVFASTCPVPEWAPGLIITAEMRCQYESYLPLIEIRTALAALCQQA